MEDAEKRNVREFVDFIKGEGKKRRNDEMAK
jgi:hypothetical protein